MRQHQLEPDKLNLQGEVSLEVDDDKPYNGIHPVRVTCSESRFAELDPMRFQDPVSFFMHWKPTQIFLSYMVPAAKGNL